METCLRIGVHSPSADYPPREYKKVIIHLASKTESVELLLPPKDPYFYPLGFSAHLVVSRLDRHILASHFTLPRSQREIRRALQSGFGLSREWLPHMAACHNGFRTPQTISQGKVR